MLRVAVQHPFDLWGREKSIQTTKTAQVGGTVELGVLWAELSIRKARLKREQPGVQCRAQDPAPRGLISVDWVHGFGKKK